MGKIHILIFILTLCISCDNATKFNKGKFYNNLKRCQQNAISLYDGFEKISIESYINDNRTYVEKGSQAFHLGSMLNQAQSKNIPILIYFTAIGCKNCRDIENHILNKLQINKQLKNDFLFIPLTVDDRTFLPEDKHIMPTENCHFYGSKDKITRIGSINVNLQGYLPNTGSQPSFYAFNINSELETIGNVKSLEEFNSYLARLK